MHTAYIGHAPVPCNIGNYLNSHAIIVFANEPNLACEIEVAHNVNAVPGNPVGRRRTYQLIKGIAGGPVAFFLTAAEALGMYRQHRNVFLGTDFPADSVNIVSYQSYYTGRIDKSCFGLIFIYQLDQAIVQFFFSTLYDIHFAQVGGETEPMQLRPGRQSAANVPCIGRTADGAVDQVQGVGDGVEYHSRAAEYAGPLADGSGQALFLAGHIERPLALAVNLLSAFV